MPHHGKTKIKLFRGLLITLAAASSATASGSSVASASASLRDRSHSQQVLSCFKHQLHALSLTWHLSACSTQEKPRHMSSVAACSSAGASTSATSSDVGAWQCQCAIDCQVELVEISPTHVTVQESIFTNLQGHIQIFSHVPQKKDCELTESNRRRCSGKNQVRVPSYLTSVGPMDPQKSDTVLFAERMRKGKYPNP